VGFNTVAVIYNDLTRAIQEDLELGRRIACAMGMWTMRDRYPQSVHFGSGKLISQAHADYTQIVAVGRNTGGPISEYHDLDWYALNEMAECLRRHGWTAKEPSKRKKAA
jgi:hypothetical protein